MQTLQATHGPQEMRCHTTPRACRTTPAPLHHIACQHQRPCSHHYHPEQPLRGSMAAHAASRSTLASGILSVLKDEQKYAASSYRKDEELLDDPPHDFEVDNPAGKRVVYLLKEYKDEQLIVEMDLEQQVDAEEEALEDEGEDDDEEDEEDLPPVTFSVQVVKANGVLAFQCVSDGEYVTIKELVLESDRQSRSGKGEDEDEDGNDSDDEDDSDSDGAYTGPPFEQLDDTLQQAFLDYLEERGVTAELGRYLQRLLADKVATEYQAWLQRVRDFVSG